MKDYHRINTSNRMDLSHPKYSPVDSEFPLTCETDPGVKTFIKLRLIQSQVDIKGRNVGKPPATYCTRFICPKCGDLLRLTPSVRRQ